MKNTSRLTPIVLALAVMSMSPPAAPAAGAKTTAKTTAKTKPAAHATKPAVPFIEDDYAGALEQARARKVPIFIEAWAPW